MGGKRNIRCGKNRTSKSGFLFQGLDDASLTVPQTKQNLADCSRHAEQGRAKSGYQITQWRQIEFHSDSPALPVHALSPGPIRSQTFQYGCCFFLPLRLTRLTAAPDNLGVKNTALVKEDLTYVHYFILMLHVGQQERQIQISFCLIFIFVSR